MSSADSNPTPSSTPAPASAPAPRHRLRRFLIGTTAVVVVGGLVTSGLLSRRDARAALETATETAAVPTVVSIHPKAAAAFEEVVLPGQVVGLSETPVYARTNGYIRSWSADIGTHVKAGDVLAVIDSPEVDQQLNQAEGDLAEAKANAKVARSNADRANRLVQTEWVSKEFSENRDATASATAAQVVANDANVKRLHELQDFEKVVAPFSGVVTSRSTDVGALINAGSGQGAELFRIADTSVLRTYVDVPQTYASQVAVGTAAGLEFPDRPGKLYPVKVTRTASAIDPKSRTLKVELDIDNASGELLPGSFTEVHFKFTPAGNPLLLPANAFLFRAEGVRVAEIGPDGKVKLQAVTLGRDFGTEVEVVTGLKPEDQVILNPSAAIAAGDPVNRAPASATKPGAS
ncbi:MAG TPA: efflux RND transporter periplasmic adaptor subunit [Terriglobales bacterium]|nr:efflux RND transporter periplasmic adaptor subunit [Terriglobales bacterium]